MIIPVWCYPVSDGARCGIISIQDRIMCVNIYCWVQVLIITYCLCKHRVSNTSSFCQVLSSVCQVSCVMYNQVSYQELLHLVALLSGTAVLCTAGSGR